MIFDDDIGRKVELKKEPKRIVSLVPSITELLFDLGLADSVVGVSDFCVHPAKAIQHIEKVGGTKNFSIEKIKQLQPDLIIAVKEENKRELVLELAETSPVVVFDVVDFASALNMIQKIGEISSSQKAAKQIVSQIQEKKSDLILKNRKEKSACYLIWNKPMMTINEQTFISEMLGFAGFRNVFGTKNQAYPAITEQDMHTEDPEYILLSSEPFSFKEKHRKAYQEKFPKSKVILVNGEMFSWYGARMIKAFEYFSECP